MAEECLRNVQNAPEKREHRLFRTDGVNLMKLCVSENGLLPKSLDGTFRKIDCILDGIGIG